MPFIERPKKQVRFGSIPKSALLKSRRPYWGSKKLFYFLLGRTSDGPAPRVRAWAGKSFPVELSNIFPMLQIYIHPESPIGIGVAMEAAPVAWSVFFAPLQGGRHGAGHGWCTAACCSRRLAFDLILLQQRSVNNQWYENSAQGFLSRKCERAAFCCWVPGWVLGMPLCLDKNFPSTFESLHFGRLRRAIRGRRATCERAIF